MATAEAGRGAVAGAVSATAGRRSGLRGQRLPVVSLTIIAVFVVAALFAHVLSPADPEEQTLTAALHAAGVGRARHGAASARHGPARARSAVADHLGLARVADGRRAHRAAGQRARCGVGLIAGYYGGRVDTVLMRVTDATMSFPVILLALILAVTAGPSFINVVIAIAVILWARFARVIRGQVLTLMELDFITQARIAGASAARIIVRHLFPNTLNTLVVLTTLQVGYVIIVEASLSFLGAGIPPPTPAWGSMIAEGRDFVTSAWWVSFFPGSPFSSSCSRSTCSATGCATRSTRSSASSEPADGIGRPHGRHRRRWVDGPERGVPSAPRRSPSARHRARPCAARRRRVRARARRAFA